jgi:hypothetical protein
MNPILKNILAVVAGCLVGGIVNMAIIMMSSSVIPPPAGADLTTVEGLKASMALMEPRHFIMPWLAHALGTLVGAFIAARFAASHQMKLAMLVGALFFIGGAVNVAMLPSPLWFTIADLGLAYCPMAYMGGKWGMRK